MRTYPGCELPHTILTQRLSPEEASGSLLNRSEWLAWALREVGAYLADLPDVDLGAG